MIEPAALAETWDQCADRLLLIARSFGGPAEDAVQEAFIALACQQQMPHDPMAWLVRVTRNHLLQWQRSQSRRRRRETFVCQESWFESEIAQVDRRLDARRVTAALLELSTPRREIIVMHLWGGMTFDTIATILEMSRASAHRGFHEGIAHLKSRFCYELDLDSLRVCHE